MPKIYAESGLTSKQACFVAEYLVDSNATRAAIAAGYSERTAARIGSELLTKPLLKAAVNAGRKRIAKKLELSAEKTLSDIDRVARKAERAKDYGQALRGHELIGKHLKLFTEKHEHGGIGGGPVVLQVSGTDEDL